MFSEGIALLRPAQYVCSVIVFEINFSVKNIEYTAEVTQTGNLYCISLDDDLLAKYVSKFYLELRADGEFWWNSFKTMNSLEMDFMIAIVPAIKKYIAVQNSPS